MSINRPNSRIEDETKSNTESDYFTKDRVSCEDEKLAQCLGDIALHLPIDSDKVNEIHSKDHDENTMHATSDRSTIFGLKNKHKLRIPSKRVSVPRLGLDWESFDLSELDVPIDHGKEINEISVASITDDNMNMRPWPVVLEPPPPPDPPNPY
ncbi:uncharacterized protein LOC134717766 [Mytilus trossulus]|uniref:uncharacterized protein LOC134717766 n=1 Tax=Mytilus trossulus TaxID=6551 RepID=UPI003005295B